MGEEELRFAIEAEGVIEFLNLGFTRAQHVDCYCDRYKEQAGKDWDEVERRLAEAKAA